MQEKKNQKKKAMILVLVLGLVLLTIGGTYAFFTYTRQGVEEHVLTTGSLYFVYDELQDQEGNQISIGNAYPVTDENGMKQDKPGMFEFEVRAKNQGADINYEIYLTKDESSTLPEKVVDTYLTTIGEKGENSAETLVEPSWDNKWTKENGVTQYQFLWNSHVPVLEEGQQGKSLYQETIPSSDGTEYSKVFRYRMWLDESADDVNTKGEWIYGDKSFTVRVNVYASNEELPSPTPVGVMQSWTLNMGGGENPFPEVDFHTLAESISISKISFANKIEKPQKATEEWDISEKQDKSVMAYMIPNEVEVCQDLMSDDGGTIQCNDIVISSNGETYGNPNSSFTFAGFANLKSIDFTNYNASLVENAYEMFDECLSLVSLNLSGWNTSSLKNIQRIFSLCTKLAYIDVSGWDTSKITNMQCTFLTGTGDDPNEIREIKGLEDWDTSSVTDMSMMFALNYYLNSLDLSNWDISNVTNMVAMFWDCSQLTTIYVKDEPTKQWFIDNASELELINPEQIVQVKIQ